MRENNKSTGNRGEGLAAAYLQNKGYKIEERNFRTRFGEIDIVCWDEQTLVFVEVKTKIGHDFGEPEEMVIKKKLSQVKRMGEVYIETRSQISDFRLQNGEAWGGGCRVDVVAIVLRPDGEVEKLEHYEAVY